jgi:hypothetical protein
MMVGKSRGEWAPRGELLVGLVGSVFNLVLLALAGRWQPLLLIPGLAGLSGVILVAHRPAAGFLLAFTGCLPGLFLLSSAAAYGPLGVLGAIPFLIPAMLMGWGVWRILGTARLPDADLTVTEVAFRCGRCGLRFAPYPNAWNNAGFCSRKCLIYAR